MVQLKLNIGGLQKIISLNQTNTRLTHERTEYTTRVSICQITFIMRTQMLLKIYFRLKENAK